jgi:hypothetical protein
VYRYSWCSLTTTLVLLFVKELVSQGARSAFDQAVLSTEREGPHRLPNIGGKQLLISVENLRHARLLFPLFAETVFPGPRIDSQKRTT